MLLESSLLGALLGGLFRLAPEVMKIWDRKAERDHEHRMSMVEVTIAEKKLEAGLRMGEQALTGKELDAIAVALKEQGDTASKAGKFVAGFSALVRPIVTYWLVALWSITKVAAFWMAVDQGADWRLVAVQSWNTEDAGMLSMILSFWFVGRVWERKNGTGS